MEDAYGDVCVTYICRKVYQNSKFQRLSTTAFIAAAVAFKVALEVALHGTQRIGSSRW